MSKVLATLDFDGVVSPIDHGRNFGTDEKFEVFRIGGFPCAISKEVLEFVRYLSELAESRPEELAVRWATSWLDLTEHFPQATGGALPELSYLPIPESKAHSIAEEVVAQGARLVLVFEDSEKVLEELEELWKTDPRLSGCYLMRFPTELEVGITFASIMAAKSVIAFELGRV